MEENNADQEEIWQNALEKLEEAIAKIKLGNAEGYEITSEMSKFMKGTEKWALRNVLNEITKTLPKEWNTGIVIWTNEWKKLNNGIQTLKDKIDSKLERFCIKTDVWKIYT